MSLRHLSDRGSTFFPAWSSLGPQTKIWLLRDLSIVVTGNEIKKTDELILFRISFGDTIQGYDGEQKSLGDPA